MKLTAILILIFCFHAKSESFGQRVSISVREAALEKVFLSIEAQTGYHFYYKVELIEKASPVNLVVRNVPFEEVLKILFKDRPLTYNVVGKNIVVTAKSSAKNTPDQDIGFIEIRGQVLDETNRPLTGATVAVKGSQKGTSTDDHGAFHLTNVDENAVLVISSIGYQSQEIKINGRTNITVRLKVDLRESEEVVIYTGYFNRNKESFTGASVAYTGKELRQANPGNLLSALSILEPSFKMIENSIAGSNPNVVPDFVVRGESSLPNLEETYKGNPNNPIFILDGFEVSVEKVFDLDPALISSVTILKDAASTAIYGSRASNGVVVIELNAPEAGTLNVLYNTDVVLNVPDLRDYNLLDSKQKLELEKAAGYYDPSGEVSADEKRRDEYNEKLRLIEKGNNTYWLNKPLQNALGHKHALSLQGGQASVRYALDLRYEKMPGVMKGSERDKTGITTMLQYRVKNIVFQNTLMYDNVKALNSPYGDFSQYAKINPYFRYDDAEGNYLKSFSTGQWFMNFPNPLYNTRLHTVDENSYNQFINNFSIDYTISPSFRLRGNISLQQKKSDGIVFKPADHTDFLTYNIPSAHLRGSYRSTEGKEFSFDSKVQLNYFRAVGKHIINSGVAVNIQEVKGDQYSFLVQGFPADKLDYLIFGLQYPEGSRPTGSDYISRLFGLVSSTNYVYDNRFLFDFSIRADASSKFGVNNMWAPFWSVGTGWNLHNEEFFKTSDIVNKLRLRASYGITGSQAFNPFQAMTQYEYYLTEPYNYLMGATMKALGNSSLKWQQTAQMNLGMDLELFKRLSITANVYRNESKSLLADITLPPSLGFQTYKENVGQLLNEGFEVSLKANLIQKRQGYLNVVVGAVKNVNTIKKISNSLSAWNESQDTLKTNKPKVRFIEGESINTIWGIPSVGINPANGREIFVRPDGTRTDVWDPSYQQPIGVADPDFEGNLGINGNYQGFTLNLYFRYRKGGQMYNSTLVERVENADKRYNTDVRVLEGRWQEQGDVTFFKDVADNSQTLPTSRFVVDYDYIQLTSLNVSYDFKQGLIQNLRMKSARISFSMNDVFRLSSVKMERGINYPFSAIFRTSLRVMF